MNPSSMAGIRGRCGRCPLLAAALLAGCVVPHPEYSDGKSPYIASRSIEKIEIGKASRADVVMLLGEPSGRHDGDRVLHYSWGAIVGFWGLGYGMTSDIWRMRKLCLAFDERGILAQKTFFDPGIFGGSPGSCPSGGAGAERE